MRDAAQLEPVAGAIASFGTEAPRIDVATRNVTVPVEGGTRQLPAAVHADFLQAFAHALHGVFLWGMALAAVPFLLSWLLKEVPLRTTLSRGAELSAEEAPAAGTPDERVLAGLQE